MSGFLTGMGAISVDLMYVIIVGFGLTFISSFLIKRQFWLQNIGMIFILFGYKTLLENLWSINKETISTTGLVHNYLSTLFLTITNPVTFLAFIAVFTGLRLEKLIVNYLSAMILV
ncbi:MAG: hypothetical protein V1773_15615 [bacterium]